jgi:hypothetical protein
MIMHNPFQIGVCRKLLGFCMYYVVYIGVGYARYCLVAKIVNFIVLG